MLVTAPLALLGWVSATSMRDQRQSAEQQLARLLTSRLSEMDRTLSVVLDGYTRTLSSSLEGSENVASVLTELRRSDPIVRQGILVSASGVLVYPTRPTADVPDDIAVYAALSGLIASRPQMRSGSDQIDETKSSSSVLPSPRGSRTKSASANDETKAMQTLPVARRSSSSRSPVAPGTPPRTSVTNRLANKSPQWQVWYMDEGSQLILWFSRSDGSSLGVLLERVRWVADLTASLPDSLLTVGGDESVSPGFTALVDEAQQIVYRWGDDGDRSDRPLAAISLSAPLSRWSLEFHADEALLPPAQSATTLYVSLLGLGVALLALGSFVLTSVGRQMNAARRRVSFAGQVSHELRTPLTNIRLYAELAEADLESLPEGASRDQLARRLSVIDSESRRLGRLVSGVLEMIQDNRKRRGPRIRQVNPDDLIDQTVKQFSPSFESVGLAVHRVAEADESVGLDPDILEMVLVNLLSNVEKYSHGGKRVDVESRLTDGQLWVSIRDHGPGIPRHKQRYVFRPFSRLDDSIDAPSGTGIGLTIARSAAQRHGGDLCLVPTSQGTRFDLTLPVTPCT